MQLSVVIPSYNRRKILEECLKALYHQTLPVKDYEVIVIDDGSSDDTPQFLERAQKKYKNFSFYNQKNQGQGVARNRGVQHAVGEVIVLIGDDIIVTQDFLSEHLRYHLHHPAEHEAVLGYIAWHPKLLINEFMNWMTNGSTVMGKFGGHQFAFEKLHGKELADFNFFYTSNISLKRTLLDKYPFDPAFSGYGWEDIELGYRLTQREGLKLYYNPQAIAYHDHFMTDESLAGRMRSIGKSAWIFHRRYPELEKVPNFKKKLVFQLLAHPITLFFAKKFDKNFYYYALSKKYFLEGLKQGKLEGIA